MNEHKAAAKNPHTRAGKTEKVKENWIGTTESVTNYNGFSCSLSWSATKTESWLEPCH